MSTTYHEPTTELSPQTREVHRALASLIEELEAVDWYNQRVDVTSDPGLKAILAHNRDEEIEHAAMALEWLRRCLPQFDQTLKTYLFTDKPITELEASGGEPAAGTAPTARGLGIGSLRKGG